MEDEYRAYREMIAAGIGVLRPSTEVKTAGLDGLERELARLDPQVVVCSRPETEEVEGRLVWVELPLDPIRPMKIRHRGGHLSESVDPTLEALLAVVDGVERLPKPEGP
jgi:hypothetical protein